MKTEAIRERERVWCQTIMICGCQKDCRIVVVGSGVVKRGNPFRVSQKRCEEKIKRRVCKEKKERRGGKEGEKDLMRC